MTMLNNIQVKAAKPTEKRYRLTDSEGLYLEVDPNGSKYWRVRVQVNGKRVAKSLGNGVSSFMTQRDPHQRCAGSLIARNQPN